jgi:octaprenyl-diphosphate synthase
MSQETSMGEILKTAGLDPQLTQSLQNDLSAIEKLLDQGIRSETNLPQSLTKYLIQTGGKRLRPLLVCLTFRSSQQTNLASESTLKNLHALAAVAEWVHTATLFHDDVIDASVERRLQPSAHILQGNKNAILVGDFVYAEAFARLMDLGLLEPSQALAHTVKKLVEGELLQHQISNSRKILMSDYEQIALAKTGALFAWAVQTGHWLATGSPQKTATHTIPEKPPIILNIEAFNLGSRLGTAFQMADDFIDTFEFNPRDCSETDLDQWKNGAPPLPVVVAHEILKESEVSYLWQALHNQDMSDQNARDLLAQLLTLTHNAQVKERCFAIFESEFKLAREKATTLGVYDSFSWALEIIYNRAQSGIESKPRFAQQAPQSSEPLKELRL